MIGIEARRCLIFADIKRAVWCTNVITDVHTEEQCARCGVKLLMYCKFRHFYRRQTDLLIAAAQRGAVKPLILKKVSFLAPWDMENVAKKVADSGNDNILLM